MDNVYAFGVECILYIQQKFGGYEEFFANVNRLADPRYTLSHFFPLLSVFDSYFASEFLLVTSIGEWLNSMLKWILVEHRPYWWVKETRFYGPIRANKPQLRLTSQTCETGPGSPSGHVMGMTIILTLISSWLSIFLSRRNSLSDRKWIKIIFWMVSVILLLLVTNARLFVATHFPHQCLIGAIFGFLTVHFILNFWMVPFMNIDSAISEQPAVYKQKLKKYFACNILVVIFLVASAFALYWGQKLYGLDPLWSVKLAFKWCPSPNFVHYDTTIQYALVKATGSVLGWAISTTPSIKNYRFFSKDRSLVLAAISALVFQQIFSQWQDSISRDDAIYFYLVNFSVNAFRPFFFIRVIPLLAAFGQKLKANTRKNSKKEENKKND